MKVLNNVFDALELLHSVGCTHNDIKPANIMIDSNYNAALIDLGYTTSFLDKQKEFIPAKVLQRFRGNILFSSKNQMKFKSTSPRDDL